MHSTDVNALIFMRSILILSSFATSVPSYLFAGPNIDKFQELV